MLVNQLLSGSSGAAATYTQTARSGAGGAPTLAPVASLTTSQVPAPASPSTIVSLSDYALQQSRSEQSPPVNASDADQPIRDSNSVPTTQEAQGEGDHESQTGDAHHANHGTPGQNLTEEELMLVEELSARDREVRQHEMAHMSVGGRYTGSAQFEYTRGPDGRVYTTGGEVSVDTSVVANDPQTTKEKMEIVIRAAMAPAEPSSTDLQVAAKARVLLAQAISELATRDQSTAAQTSTENNPLASAEEANKGDDAAVIAADQEVADIASQAEAARERSREVIRILMEAGQAQQNDENPNEGADSNTGEGSEGAGGATGNTGDSGDTGDTGDTGGAGDSSDGNDSGNTGGESDGDTSGSETTTDSTQSVIDSLVDAGAIEPLFPEGSLIDGFA